MADKNDEALSPDLYTPEATIENRKVEADSLEELPKIALTQQKGTPIPAIFNIFYKYIQNPSTVSVETFKRMVDTDDTIGSGVDFLTTCLTARLGIYEHESDEVAEFVNKALGKIQGGFYAAVKEMMSSCWAGFSVAEMNWANHEMGFIVDEIVALPPSTILFETDRNGKLTPDGILQYQRYLNPGAQGYGSPLMLAGTMNSSGFAGYRPDAYAKVGDMPFPVRTANRFTYMSIRIPREKCIHYPFNAQGAFGNPYGRSLLRRAYKYYVLKDAVLQMLAIALDRKGTPLMVVFADQNATLRDPEKVGNETQNVKGQSGKGMRADVAAQRAFSQVHNDSVIVLPGKKDQIFSLETVDMTNSKGEFIAALDFCNKSIMRSLLIPSLIFTNGDGSGSYALGQEHAKTFEKILDGNVTYVDSILINQYVRQLIQYNFPESAWKKDGFGSFSKREFTDDEKDKIMDTYEKGINTGVIDRNDLKDLNKMRDTIGFEPRTTPIETPMDRQMEGGGQDDEGEAGGARGPKNGSSNPSGGGSGSKA